MSALSRLFLPARQGWRHKLCVFALPEQRETAAQLGISHPPGSIVLMGPADQSHESGCTRGYEVISLITHTPPSPCVTGWMRVIL